MKRTYPSGMASNVNIDKCVESSLAFPIYSGNNLKFSIIFGHTEKNNTSVSSTFICVISQ